MISFDNALKINPEDTMSLYKKGISLTQLGKNQEGIECYEKALEFDPNFKLAKRKLKEKSGLNYN